MAKDLKGKRASGGKKGAAGSKKEGFSRKTDNNNDHKEKSSSRSNKDKRPEKPAFERYRDESRPSDFGSSGKGAPRSPKRSGSSFPKKDKEKDGESASKEERSSKSSKPFFKKPFSKEAGPVRKASKNPNDLDESDFDHEKPKSDFDKKPGKGFKGRGYEKRPYVKKTWGDKPKAAEKLREDDGSTRLNKYIANAGICSRREADDLIASGVVQVNGKTITEMGYRVKPTDIIKYGGQTLKKERMVYLILNKPKDYITTADDPQKRKTVLELIQGACKERIYPVGRLDRATTGLLMFTNDGDLTKKLTHPKYGVKKIYHVELDKPLKRADLDKIAEGLELEDGPIKVDEISYVANGIDKTQVGVEIHSGKNRIVRRIFEHMGYNVRKLDRVMFGPLTKKDMPRGRWRFLTDSELGMLKMISAE
jgi:23S rRNA pseudouridine2605 synthase